MAVFDVLSGDNYGVRSLTDSINKMPFVPGRAGQLGIFEEFGVSTEGILLEERDGWLTLIPTTPRGAPATQATVNKMKTRTLQIPHIALEDTIQASELRDVREFGTENQQAGVESEISRRQMDHAASFDATLEHLRVSALKGIVMDADGVTPIYDLFAEFGVSALAEVDFSFDTASVGDIRTTCHGISRDMQREMPNVMFNHIHAFCGDQFFDDLVAHDEVRAAYDRWMEGEWLRMGLVYRMFPYAGIVFENYHGYVGATDFVNTDKAHFFPVGARGLFRNPFAPADFVETEGTMGLPRYSKQAVDPEFQRYVKLHSQSNPLPYCTRPRVLRQAKRT